MGLVFQFVIGKLKSLDKNQKRIVKSIETLHRDSYNARTDPKRQHRAEKTVPRRKVHSSPPTKPQILTGNLRLNYQGRSADTRAVFMLDKDD